MYIEKLNPELKRSHDLHSLRKHVYFDEEKKHLFKALFLSKIFFRLSSHKQKTCRRICHNPAKNIYFIFESSVYNYKLKRTGFSEQKKKIVL